MQWTDEIEFDSKEAAEAQAQEIRDDDDHKLQVVDIRARDSKWVVLVYDENNCANEKED